MPTRREKIPIVGAICSNGPKHFRWISAMLQRTATAVQGYEWFVTHKVKTIDSF